MSVQSHIFDPRHYTQVRRPHLEAETLPPWCYTSAEFYQREIDRMFRTCWNFVGREDEIPEAGSYLTLEMFGEPVILIRDGDGEVRAFANTCRHRGTRLLRGSGTCRAIICPYHAWTYSLKGDLVGIPGMEETAGFRQADYGLKPLRLETWDGFMFVSFSHAAPPLREYLGDLPEKFAPYRFSEMICVRRKEYDLACNWKLYLENAMEDYHTPMVHRGSIGNQICVREDTRGQWDAIHMASERSAAVLPEDRSTLPHIPQLSGRPAWGTYFTVLYPGTFFATTQDCMWWLQQLPCGPHRTRVVVGSCFPRETVARDDFEREVQKYYHRWDTSLPEDNAICEEQQAGLASSLSTPGRLSSREPIVHAIANWVLDRVLDAPAAQ